MEMSMEWKYTKENPLRVVTLCSGYDSQLYKMAGNSIVVPVLEGIFTQLFRKDNECLF